MKKKFAKPEIQRISLNFHENIVASEVGGSTGGYNMRSQDASSCLIVTTQYLYSDVADPNRDEPYLAARVCLIRGVSMETAARMMGRAL